MVSGKPPGVSIILSGHLLLFQLFYSASATAEILPPDPAFWKPVTATEAGQIYHRDIENSSIPMIMITTKFKGNAAQVHAVVTDYEHFAEFIPNVVESRVLLRKGNDQWVFHHLRFPGPVADRVYVVKSTDTIGSEAKDYRVKWQLAQRHFHDADLSAGIKPRGFSGLWELHTAVDDDFTEARYAVHSDPGGMIPAWLVETMTDRYVQQVIEAIRKRLRSP